MCDWCNEYPNLVNDKTTSTDIPEQWGLSKSMCVRRLNYNFKMFKDGGYTFDDNYKQDYARLFSLTSDEALIDDCLQKLDGKITAKANEASPETNWLRLSSSLSYFEKMCGFPEDVLLPMGILTADIFYSGSSRNRVGKLMG